METNKIASISTFGFVLRPVVALIMLGMVCLTGCREEDALEISESSLDFTIAGERKSFFVESNTNWTITVSRDAITWLTVSPTSGAKDGTVDVSASANSPRTPREATITVSGGDKVRTLSVKQEGETLSVSEVSLNFPATGDNRTVSVTSNIFWRVVSSDDWLTVSPASGTNDRNFTATATANTSISPREATITVSGGELKQTISVTQSEGEALLSVHSSNNYETEPVETVSFESSNALSKTLYINSNASWEVNSSESWLTVDPASGSNRQTVSIRADYNTSISPRTATLTFSGGGITRTVDVTQEEFVASLSLSTTSYDFGSGTGSRNVNIYATISWEVTTDAAWLTVTPSSGTYNGSITVRAEANPTIDQRTATVTVSGGELTQTFTATQSAGAAFLTVSETLLEFPETSEQLTFDILANTNWEVQCYSSWLSFSPCSGSGDGTVTFTSEANITRWSRTAIITVIGSDIQRRINVTQEGSILSVGNSSGTPISDLYFSSDISPTNIYIQSLTNWTVSSDVSWLTFSQTSGDATSTASITVTPSPNFSTSQRIATISVSAGGIIRTVSVTQHGAINTGSIMFYTNRDRYCGYIRVTLNGQETKNITGWFNYNPGCGAGNTATFAELPPGAYTYTASCGSYSWSGTVNRTLSCHPIRLE